MIDIVRNRLIKFQETLDKFPNFRYVGDPILRNRTEIVDFEEGREIGKKLGEVLVRYRRFAKMGRGLAAPQIGLSKSVFVTFLDDRVQTYINPSITGSSEDTNFFRELCLSSGVVWPDVERPATINLQWTDETNNRCEQEFTGLIARLIQHEYDHLQGIVNLDKACPGSIEFVLSDPLQEKLRDQK